MGRVTVLPATETAAFRRAKAVLDTRDRGPVGWMSNSQVIEMILKALLYEDGADEDIAIQISGRRFGVDPVTAIEVHDEWIRAFLGDRA